jgi:hypothetical protein
MPSPFPGMDPFIEDQKWKPFHTQFVTALGHALVPQVRPKYVVDVEEYVFLAQPPDDPHKIVEPDVALSESGKTWLEASSMPQSAVTLQPAVLTLPRPERLRQPYLVISTRAYKDVV